VAVLEEPASHLVGAGGPDFSVSVLRSNQAQDVAFDFPRPCTAPRLARFPNPVLVPASQTNLVSTSPWGLMFSTMRATHISTIGWKTAAPDQTPEKDRRVESIAESGGVMV